MELLWCLLVTTLAQKLKREFRLDVDVQSTADGILTRGLKNREGNLIIDDGVDIPWLVEEIQRGSNFMVKTKQHGWTKLSLWLSVDRGLDADGTLEDGFPSTFGGDALIVAKGKKGSHSSHALHAAKIEYEPILKVECDNSWGNYCPHPIVPGPVWNTIVRFYRVHFDNIEVKVGSVWVELFAGGFHCGESLIVDGKVEVAFGKGHYDNVLPIGTCVTLVSKSASGLRIGHGISEITNDNMLYFRVPDGRIGRCTEWYAFKRA